MFDIHNKTPFAVTMSPQINLQGHDVVLVYCAASCVLSEGKWHVCEAQMDAPMGDQPWNDEKPSSLRYPSLLSHNKPGTDVIIHGHAAAPQGKAVSALQANVNVGQLAASVIVFGDRVWHNGNITQPRPFAEMPIMWENAFGGQSQPQNPEEAPLDYEYNPYGLGWTHKKHPKVDGKRLPNIEDPHALIRSPSDAPMPAGFSAIAAESPLRAKHAGTYDEAWKTKRAPFAPEDLNPAFFHAAIPQLQSKGFMRGDEPVRLENFHPAGDINFYLPNIKPKGHVFIRQSQQDLNFGLQTIIIETKALIVRMFWQAVLPAPRSIAQINSIHVALGR